MIRLLVGTLLAAAIASSAAAQPTRKELDREFHQCIAMGYQPKTAGNVMCMLRLEGYTESQLRTPTNPQKPPDSLGDEITTIKRENSQADAAHCRKFSESKLAYSYCLWGRAKNRAEALDEQEELEEEAQQFHFGVELPQSPPALPVPPELPAPPSAEEPSHCNVGVLVNGECLVVIPRP